MIDVMIITRDEEANLPHCLAALQGWVRRTFVIDSGSTDRTVEIAETAGATVVHHEWEGYARQKNWGLENLPFESDWILILDADEVVTPALRDRLLEIVSPERVHRRKPASISTGSSTSSAGRSGTAGTTRAGTCVSSAAASPGTRTARCTSTWSWTGPSATSTSR